MLLNVYDINKVQVYCFVYNILNGGYNTAQVSEKHVIRHSRKARANCIRFIDTKNLNLLACQIINSPTLYVFK